MLILASSSPRRQNLLRRLGVVFEIATADIDESQRPGEPPIDLVQRLAREKALAVAGRFPDYAVLGADTIVVLYGEVLGKPVDAEDAVAMLRRLRDLPHTVWSAVYALNPALGCAAALNETTVWMRAYSDDEIAAYVASGDPLDKAGAYAIQHPDFSPAERIVGCYSGVMGFPLGDVARMLRAVGVGMTADVAAACQPQLGLCCQVSAGRFEL
ncbi:MAG TPA: Maf family protein [Anaerolineae bacterium]|nr:Maf family protein [Anaerolineae bacterium]